MEQQESKQLNEDPVFSVEEIIPRVNNIQKEYLKVKAIAKPRKVLMLILFHRRRSPIRPMREPRNPGVVIMIKMIYDLYTKWNILFTNI